MPGELSIRMATPDDALALSDRLNLLDQLEIAAAGSTPLQSLLHPFRAGFGSRTWAGVAGDHVLAIGGVIPRNPNVGFAWLLADRDLANHGARAFRLARHMLAREGDGFPLVISYALDHPERLRMLRILGFDIDPAFLHIGGVRFRQIRRRRHGGPEGRRRPA